MLPFIRFLKESGVPTSVVPNIVSAIGLTNSVLTFVLTGVLERRSMIQWRRAAWFSLAALWVSIFLCFIDLFHSAAIANIKNFGVKCGLILWTVSLCNILFLVYRIFSTSTTAPSGTTFLLWRHQKLRPFNVQQVPRFGVPFLDQMLNLASAAGGRIYFPILVMSDRNACGIVFTQRFLARGLSDGEGAVYLAFTRPAVIVARQIAKFITHPNNSWMSRFIIIDCYEDLYIPDEATQIGHPPTDIKVESCDPRNPFDVQKKLLRALSRLQKAGSAEVRVVYDSLSDFLAIADPEMVVSYLRRSIVWEETFNIKALYLVWPHLMTEPLSDEYLSWFGNSTLWLHDKGNYFQASLEGVENRPISFPINADLQIIDMTKFAVDKARAKVLSAILKSMKYHPADMADITPFAGDEYREMHFIFFLTSIDHDTHGPAKYETFVNGNLVHGSDLLYHQARVATSSDKDLFTPSRMENISVGKLNAVFAIERNVKPKNLTERAKLLRDGGKRLHEQYSGDVRRLFEKAEFCLRSQGQPGILELLREFKAYEDPLEKKSFLLVKLLRRRDLLVVKDPNEIGAPIDHVLFTLALRSGLVVADADTRKLILDKECLNDATLSELRLATLRAYQMVGELANIAIDEFDDLLWAFGRECLRLPAPFPEKNVTITTSLDQRIENKAVIPDFIRFINGIDGLAPIESSRYPIPVFGQTTYF